MTCSLGHTRDSDTGLRHPICVRENVRIGTSITGRNDAILSSYSAPLGEAGRWLASLSRTVVDVPALRTGMAWPDRYSKMAMLVRPSSARRPRPHINYRCIPSRRNPFGVRRHAAPLPRRHVAGRPPPPTPPDSQKVGGPPAQHLAVVDWPACEPQQPTCDFADKPRNMRWREEECCPPGRQLDHYLIAPCPACVPTHPSPFESRLCNLKSPISNSLSPNPQTRSPVVRGVLARTGVSPRLPPARVGPLEANQTSRRNPTRAGVRGPRQRGSNHEF